MTHSRAPRARDRQCRQAARDARDPRAVARRRAFARRVHARKPPRKPGSPSSRTRCSRRASPRASAALPAIADDSGLEVDALHGAPGIYSARYAGPGADDAANNAKLLHELGVGARAARTARYRCAMVYLRWPEDPAPVDRAGGVGRPHRPRAARHRRLRLRPAVPGRRRRAHRGGTRRPTTRTAQPSRPGAARRWWPRSRPARHDRRAAAIPLALYVHLPWCVRKCPYCDFNSHAVPAAARRAGVRRRAARRPRARRERARRPRDRLRVLRRRHAQPVLPRQRSRSVLERARGCCRSRADVEITLEANPGTIEHGRFADYAAAGVNRVSLGAQSFDDAAARGARPHPRAPVTSSAPWANCAPPASTISTST